MFKPVDPKPDFPTLEGEVLDAWRVGDIPRKALTRNAGKPRFVFYEGPPTANGRPHPGHVLTRVVKDVFLRYRSMCGFDVLRKAGWDTHGLPVELEVEKALGLDGKDQIEKYGVAPFIEKCRESVWKYEKEWRAMTERIGFWIDMDDPYVTLHNDYIESVWWILSELWKKGLLYQGHKVVPYCPRCETALSSHEVAQGYRETDDPSVFVRFPVRGEENTSFLVWTTTPWTLISNVAVALGEDIEYAVVEKDGERLILAGALVEKVLGEGAKVLETRRGADLAGKEYEPPFSFCKVEKKAHYAVLADFVSLSDGTGIVHLAPAFGEDDYRMGEKHGLPFLQPVDGRGRFTEEVTPWKGTFVKAADPDIIGDLKGRGVLFREETCTHTYPFCWRCDSPLLYYGRASWFIRTTAVKDRLLAANESVNWIPDHIKKGRMGDFLENNVDWAVSRDRYWGTPLNIWTCGSCGARECPSGVEALRALGASFPEGEADLHKPWIDGVTVPCPQCGGAMRRVPEVIDCWLDSGAMPVAQWGYPKKNGDRFDSLFPADFITEAVDQTRGWFYSLLALGALLFDKSPFKTCLVLGLVQDKEGQKMSKSRGNVVDPWETFQTLGADPFRWYLFRENSAWVNTRFYQDAIRETQRNFFLRLWNVYSFFTIYANIDGYEPAGRKVPFDALSAADRWMLARLNAAVAQTREAMDAFNATAAARALESLADDLSNWYLRRCRARFWKPEKPEQDDDKLGAYQTLHRTLATLTKALAPFTPFFSETLYENLVRNAGLPSEESVHFEAFPEIDPAAENPELLADMERVREIVNDGLSIRKRIKLKVRQPLSRIVVTCGGDGEKARLGALSALIEEELNVKEVEFASDLAGFSAVRAKPDFKTLGPKFGKDVQALTQFFKSPDGLEPSRRLAETGSVSVSVGGKTFDLAAADFSFDREEREGFAVGRLAALDVRLTEELKLEGQARDFVRAVQNARKEMNLNYTDRIVIDCEAAGERPFIKAHAAYIMGETLATDLRGVSELDGPALESAVDGAGPVKFRIVLA